ncbi:MAG: hypothetical protein AABX17_02445 [Nanoarchaeota archaeon]
MNEVYYAIGGFMLGGIATVLGFISWGSYQLSKAENESLLQRYTESYNAGILNIKPTLKNVREIEESFRDDFPANERFLVKKSGLEVSVLQPAQAVLQP